ncbi:hypothetical protein Caka_2076 [Coraliomargarita akajimensis DSM 45221]|uniref:Uncharacterized protein n=1 Tax=Coraliomargarita akajimensis (strain DSM 45221 / IAM 15411 / JCM 23193 / KCTC 12865 / 04OKA010-24) TaxID=583355 RepID=D5ELF8_CORAD|nr:hypothetical protein Caka_2076 [Coraliomargarita akajimensis DSM 45221]
MNLKAGLTRPAFLLPKHKDVSSKFAHEEDC